MGFLGLFPPNVEKLTEKRNVNGLIKALKYEDSGVRWAAKEALGKLKGK